jgi:dolichol-phosphate mannosyltransferase
MNQTKTANLPQVEGDLNAKSEIGLILPTYCEVSNIEKLIGDIESLNLDVRVLVIDDSSPDGTATAVRRLQKKYKNILLLVRPKKSGLGTAITDGFKTLISLKNPPSYIVTMDADYSHNPKEVPRAISTAREGKGLAIGSRYCKGGGVAKWSIIRRLTSRVANILAYVLVRAKIHDYTSGLRCYSTKLVREMVPDLHSETYEIQIETIRQACKRGFDVREFPMTFVNRKNGKSKLSANEIKEFTSYIFKIKRLKSSAG